MVFRTGVTHGILLFTRLLDTKSPLWSRISVAYILAKASRQNATEIQQPGSNLIAEKAALLATQQRFVDLPSKRTDSSLGTQNSFGSLARKVEKRSIKNWMGPYQRTPKEVARAIRFSGLGVCSVGPVGDFLDKGDCDVNSSKFKKGQ